MGRVCRGVKGITLGKGDWVVGCVVVKRDATLLVVSENGYGKRSDISDYRMTHRGGKGIITIKNTIRNGDVVAIKETVETDELMIITQGGVVIRLPIRGVKVIGRNTQGVKLINLDERDKVVDVARVVPEEE
ncbi:DNA gyrase subunit A [subsurface metagenome]